ncbi:trehalose synthase, partial [Ferroplasma sp.]|uniref:trehalose synthase n=1 Tax=Ferroplasma sp. TaxID=2591003 RepID=UPI00307E03D8
GILWTTSAFAFIQIMGGFYLSQIENPLTSYVLILHIFTGIILFGMAIITFIYTKGVRRLKHLATVNASLIVITALLGFGFIVFKSSIIYSTYIPYLEMALAIGIISNYAVMLGIKRTLDLVNK